MQPGLASTHPRALPLRQVPCISDIPASVIGHPHDPASNDEIRTSDQRLGAATVTVEYDVCFDAVIVQGVQVHGEVVDPIEFAKRTVDAWERAIAQEISHG